jgi:hypothetical protein
MAIYTTLFVATDAELTDFFPGWRVPRKKPVLEERTNPFTGELVRCVTWDPGRKPDSASGSSLFSRHRRKTIPPVLPPEDDYQRGLEENAPALLRTFPHVAMKGITGFELLMLAQSLLNEELPPARFVDCREDEGMVEALPAAAAQPLASLADDRLAEVVSGWGAGLYDGGEGGGLLWALLRIRALAKEAVRRKGQVYSHTRG